MVHRSTCPGQNVARLTRSHQSTGSGRVLFDPMTPCLFVHEVHPFSSGKPRPCAINHIHGRSLKSFHGEVELNSLFLFQGSVIGAWFTVMGCATSKGDAGFSTLLFCSLTRFCSVNLNTPKKELCRPCLSLGTKWHVVVPSSRGLACTTGDAA